MSFAALDSRSHSADVDDSSSDPNGVVASAQQSIAELVGEQVSVRLVLSPDATPVAVPRAELKRILLGLCREASRSLGQGGRLLIETRGTNDPELSTEADPARELRSRIIVCPELCARPPRVVSRVNADLVFGKFEQLLDELGVQLELVPMDGYAVALVVHLPSASMVSSARVAVAAPHGARLILLVEDEPQVLAVTARILRAFGYAVVTAHDARTAFAHAEQYGSEIGLVMSDLVLPGVSGTDLVRRLRDFCAHAATLYVSGYSAEHVGALADDARFLRKPFTVQELLGTVRGLMRLTSL